MFLVEIDVSGNKLSNDAIAIVIFCTDSTLNIETVFDNLNENSKANNIQKVLGQLLIKQQTFTRNIA